MKLPLIPDIAVTMLKARMKQSVVAAVGVTFGIATFIALISFMNGLNQFFDNLILNRTPHVRIYNEIKPSEKQPIDLSPRYGQHHNFIHSIKPKDRGQEIYNSSIIIEILRADKRVQGVTPQLTQQVFFNSGPIEIGGVVYGIDITEEEKLFSLSDYVTDGDINDLNNSSNGIFIGKGIADKMMLTKGDIIQLTTASGGIALLKVEGIIQFGFAEIDNVTAYTSLRTARKLLGKPDSYVTDIRLKLHDITIAPQMATELKQMFTVEAKDIQSVNAEFETGNKIRSLISYAVGITLLVVAGFGIYNILNMMIYEKMDSIAILKATGFAGRDVKRIFIYLSLIIGVTGGSMGLILGYVLSLIISYLPFETTSLPTIKTFPVSFSAVYYLVGISFALVTTYIAGLLPARRASEVDPVIIIRGK
ncbi:MAG: ABC transporter permease [Sphingobacteriaceae bacterium]